MSSSGYQAWAVTAGEIPTTAYWNILGGNDASFNSGTGINDGAIVTRHLAANAVSYLSYAYNEVVATASTSYTNNTATFSGPANWASGTFTTHGGTIFMNLSFSCWNTTANAGAMHYRIMLNGSSYVPSATGSSFFFNAASTHTTMSKTYIVTGLVASSYTAAIQLSTTGGTVTADTGDFCTLTILETLA